MKAFTELKILRYLECSVVNLKFAIPGFIDVFGRDGHNNWGPAILLKIILPFKN